MSSFDPRIAEALGRAVPLRAEVAPVWSDVLARAERRKRHARPRWKVVLVAAVIAIGLVGVGVAIANGFGVFDGIGAVQHPQTPADVIDPATRAYMAHSSMPGIIGLRWGTARRLGQLSDGHNVYVMGTTTNQLCFLVGPPYPEWQCRDPLSRRYPTADFAYTVGPKPWATIGVAANDVTAVTFDANGHGDEVTVPVRNNFWTYSTSDFDALNAPLLALTVHYADGRTKVDGCPMC